MTKYVLMFVLFTGGLAANEGWGRTAAVGYFIGAAVGVFSMIAVIIDESARR